MKRISYLAGFCVFFVFAFTVVSFSQSNNYEKSILFTLEWGNDVQQIGYRHIKLPDYSKKIGPLNYTVTPNNLIWIYDVVQNSIKAFSFDGELAHVFKLLEDPGIEGFITSDEYNNIWFHDAMDRRVLVLNYNGELQKTIKYESDSVWGKINIINGKPVLHTLNIIDTQRKSTDNGYGNKPEYEAQLVDIDRENVFNPFRGKKTNRFYRTTQVNVSNEGEIIPPRLFINNQMVKGFGFDEEIVRNYFVRFVREDYTGNFYINLFPNSYEKDIFPYIIKYNENIEKVASIELPVLPQYYGFACSPTIIDDTGNIYYMMLRSESITLLKWTQLNN